MSLSKQRLSELYGNIDIYLFDQLLKGTYQNCSVILDAGCGGGRNGLFFMTEGCEVYGVDLDAANIDRIRQTAASITGAVAQERFHVAPVENMPFENESFDLVISSAVLHFAKNQQHFEDMLLEMWRVLRPGGYFFCRLASDIGIENTVQFIGNGRYILPDGTERFLVNQEMLIRLGKRLHATLHEPVKTTVVQGMRSMSTWCLKKGEMNE